MIDTGASNSAIPESDIDTTATPPNLKYIGPYHTWGLGFDGYLSIYEANLKVGDEESYDDFLILGTPDIITSEGETKRMPAIIGREIISKYKWEIDFKTKAVKATKQ